MSFAVDAIDHVEVFVTDLEQAARWYRQVLGLTEQARWDPEPVMIGVGGTQLALFRAVPDPPAAEPERTRRWHRVAWGTDARGFEQAQRHLAACGVPFRGPVDHKTARSIYFQDPDGHRLEITTYESSAARAAS
jgi:catechol-2,3-dioxygenase